MLLNGEEKFPELLACLEKAKHHIHMEYYIYEQDEIGKAYSILGATLVPDVINTDELTSGEVVGVNLSTGASVWTENLTQSRGSSSMASMTDAARPVIDSGMVYAVGNAGRMIATSLRSEMKSSRASSLRSETG